MGGDGTDRTDAGHPAADHSESDDQGATTDVHHGATADGLVRLRTASGSSYALEGQRVIRVRDGLPAERYRLISLDRRLRYTDGQQIWTTSEVVDRAVS